MVLLNKYLTTLKAFIILWIHGQVSRACNDRSTCKCVMYSFHHESLTWKKSRELCQKDSGDLVSMETDKEWKYLSDFIQNLAGSSHSEYFIGLLNEKGSWRWLSNVSIDVPGQKWRWHNNQPSGDGNCVVMYKNYAAGNNPMAKRTKGYFNDLPCNSRGAAETKRGFICEKTVDCSCKNEELLYGKSTTASPRIPDGRGQKDHKPDEKFKFILTVVVGSLDVVLFIVTLVLCRGIFRRNHRCKQAAGRRNVVKRK